MLTARRGFITLACLVAAVAAVAGMKSLSGHLLAGPAIKLDTDLATHLKKKRNYFALDWDPSLSAQPFTFLNLSAGEFPDKGSAVGLEYVVSGAQFNYRIPLAMTKLAPKQNFSLIDLGVLPSPFKLHNDNALPLGSGYFDETLIIGSADGQKVTGKFVNSNCFSCHAGRLQNTIVGGMYNKDIDLTVGSDNFIAMSKLDPIKRRLAGLTDGEYQIARRVVSLYESMMRPILSTAKNLGDNQGQYISIAFGTFLKPGTTNPDDTVPMTFNDEMKKHFCADCKIPPVQAMPWWSVKYKSKHYYFGDSSTEPLQQMQDFVVNFATPNHGYYMSDSSWEARVERQYWIFRYVNATVSPVHPDVSGGRINRALATRGREIFHGAEPLASGRRASCASCHGSYTPSGAGYLVDYKDSKQAVGTDPGYHMKLVETAYFSERISKLKDRNKIGPKYELPTDPLVATYSVPPLDGVWASAPYLHNGSVPTVRQVLLPETRPKLWARHGGSGAYDLEKLGLPHGPAVQAGVPARLARKLLYNTTEEGFSNAGHSSQVAGISEGDADALIEFFKCLGGPNMKSARDKANALAAVTAGHPCEGMER